MLGFLWRSGVLIIPSSGLSEHLKARLSAGAIPDMIEASLHGVSQIFIVNHAGAGQQQIFSTQTCLGGAFLQE